MDKPKVVNARTIRKDKGSRKSRKMDRKSLRWQSEKVPKAKA